MLISGHGREISRLVATWRNKYFHASTVKMKGLPLERFFDELPIKAIHTLASIAPQRSESPPAVAIIESA